MVIVKKTTDLSALEIQQILHLFCLVFKKSRTLEEFKGEFINTSKGYSYHALLYDAGNIIMGHNAYIPFLYNKDNTSFETVLSVDAMIHPTWRGKGVH